MRGSIGAFRAAGAAAALLVAGSGVALAQGGGAAGAAAEPNVPAVSLRQTAAFPVHTVDTLGAGDVFHGAFAHAITEDQSIPSALRFASAAAALKCTRFGGAFAAPQRAEVEELLLSSQPESPGVAGQ